ncbi:MAG: adenylate/guanylate cyclase domain-containing protein [Geminicoccaceae bacterium]
MTSIKAMLQHPKRPVIAALSLVVACLVALAASSLPFVGTVEYFLRDLRIAYLTPPLPQHPDIVIVELTEDTLDTFTYRSPPDRSFLADLVDRMNGYGVRALGIDILMNRPTEPEPDRRLQSSLEKASVPVILATATTRVADIDEGDVETQANFARDVIQGDAVMIRDPIDGFVRRQRPFPPDNDDLPTFAAAVARASGIEPPDEEMSIAWRVTEGRKLPPFRSYAAHQVSLLPPAWFQDRIVLIGGNLPDIDRYMTPLSRRENGESTAGVVVQAHKLAQIVDGRRLPEAGIAGDVASVVILAGMGIAIAFSTLPLLAKVVALLGSIVAWWVFAFWLFGQGGPLLALVLPSLAMITGNGVQEALEGGAARRERRFIREAFQHFVAPAVVQTLIDDPSRLKLGGERRDISTIFTDIKGFTSLSEQLVPERMNALLNDYLDVMLQVILDHDGTIDKVVGDALHCFFGAPGDQPDHAQRAYDCALALDRTSEAFLARVEAGGEMWGMTRIGVHTGNVLVGNFGGRLRFNYTAHGDAVNTAARLEGANKYLGTRVCISRATLDGCTACLARPSAELLPVGKEIPVAVFDPVEADDEALASYRKAYALMQEDRMHEARAILLDLLGRNPQDGLVAMHLERIEAGEKGVLIRLENK